MVGDLLLACISTRCWLAIFMYCIVSTSSSNLCAFSPTTDLSSAIDSTAHPQWWPTCQNSAPSHCSYFLCRAHMMVSYESQPTDFACDVESALSALVVISATVMQDCLLYGKRRGLIPSLEYTQSLPEEAPYPESTLRSTSSSTMNISTATHSLYLRSITSSSPTVCAS